MLLVPFVPFVVVPFPASVVLPAGVVSFPAGAVSLPAGVSSAATNADTVKRRAMMVCFMLNLMLWRLAGELRLDSLYPSHMYRTVPKRVRMELRVAADPPLLPTRGKIEHDDQDTSTG